MFWDGSLMSQVLQWTQFWWLIWKRFLWAPVAIGPGAEALGGPASRPDRGTDLVRLGPDGFDCDAH
jgi:hypothetical protein